MNSLMKIIPLVFLLVSCTVLTSKNYGDGPVVTGVREHQKAFKVIWSKNNDPEYETGNLPIALNSPFVYAGILFAGHNNGFMIAYELENGREIWRKPDKGGYHSSPIIYKDYLLYGTNQGRLYARHYLTGRLKYEIDLGASVESKIVVNKGRAFVHLRNNRLVSLDVETGKILWAYKRSIPYLTTLQRVSKPAVGNGKVYVGFADGFVAAFSIEEGNLLWERKLTSGTKFIDVDNSPVLVGNNVYIGSLAGPLYLLNALTGTIIRQSDFTASRAPSVKDGKILLGTVSGEVLSLDKNFAPLKIKKLGDGAVTSIVKWKGKLAVSTVTGNLYFLNPVDFSVIEHKHLGHSSSAIFGNMVVHEGKLALISSRNRIYVFK